MPKVTGGVTAAILAVLLLSGCAATTTTGNDTESTPAAAPTPTETVEPLVAEKPAETTYASKDEEFIAKLMHEREIRIGGFDTQIPNATDEQLVAAAHDACDQLPDLDYDPAKAHVIEGETANSLGIYPDSALIAGIAMLVYCPKD